jgi:hypothetical protein
MLLQEKNPQLRVHLGDILEMLTPVLLRKLVGSPLARKVKEKLCGVEFGVGSYMA